jgi:hypothetical protein
LRSHLFPTSITTTLASECTANNINNIANEHYTTSFSAMVMNECMTTWGLSLQMDLFFCWIWQTGIYNCELSWREEGRERQERVGVWSHALTGRSGLSLPPSFSILHYIQLKMKTTASRSAWSTVTRVGCVSIFLQYLKLHFSWSIKIATTQCL